MRETHGYEKSIQDLLNGLADGTLVRKKGNNLQMWHTIAKWSVGLLEGFKDFKEVNKKEKYLPQLKKIAVINLKKEPGGRSANMKIVREHAEKNTEFINDQIKKIKPKIIIACGTYEILKGILSDQNQKYSKIIPMRHPSRANQEKTYQELAKKIKEKM